MRHVPLSVVALALAAPLSAQAQVWIVDDDGGPGTDFVDVQRAVDAAAQGDTVYVHPGLYSSFVIDGKALTLHAPAYAATVLPGGSVVRNLAADQQVTLHGINFVVPVGDLQITDALHVRNCQGTVWIEEGAIEGGICPAGQCTTGEGFGLVVENSSAVLLNRCALRGGETWTLSEGGHGMLVRGSIVHLYDTNIVGGAGLAIPPSPMPPDGAPGGDAVVVDGGSLYSYGGNFEGAIGGYGEPPLFPIPCSGGGDGGAGLRILGTDSIVTIVGTQPVGGHAGIGGPGCADGQAGPAIADQGTGTVLSQAPGLQPRFLAAPSPLVGGQDLATLVVSGEPTDEIVLLLDAAASPLYLPALQSALALPSSFAIVHLGFLPVNGVLFTQFASPALPVGLDSFELFLQLAYKPVGGVASLGGPAHVVILRNAP